jgi:sugar (pentulose or hexulose) kinase
VEATALGNLVVQMIAAGALANRDQARALIRDSSELAVYEPGASAAWDSAYAHLRELLTQTPA